MLRTLERDGMAAPGAATRNGNNPNKQSPCAWDRQVRFLAGIGNQALNGLPRVTKRMVDAVLKFLVSCHAGWLAAPLTTVSFQTANQPRCSAATQQTPGGWMNGSCLGSLTRLRDGLVAF